MTKRKFFLLIILFLALAGIFDTAEAISIFGRKKPAKTSTTSNTQTAKNIVSLFTEKNPKLSKSTAENYASIILEAAKKYNQDPYIIAAIIVHESTVNNKAVSKGGDYGLMQIRWKVHAPDIKKEYPKVKNASGLFDARTNIFYGTKIFASGMAKVNNDVRKGILRYSAGNSKLADKVIATANSTRKRKA